MRTHSMKYIFTLSIIFNPFFLSATSIADIKPDDYSMVLNPNPIPETLIMQSEPIERQTLVEYLAMLPKKKQMVAKVKTLSTTRVVYSATKPSHSFFNNTSYDPDYILWTAHIIDLDGLAALEQSLLKCSHCDDEK